MSPTWEPVSPHGLAARTARWLATDPGLVRVAVDGPPFVDPDGFAASLVEPLQSLGRPTAHVAATAFWRDASLRLEHGHQDWESYLTWLDADALRREVLVAAADADAATYLPSLRDPESNRATREPPRPVAPATVLLVSGAFLLGRGLPFDRTIHLHTSPGARERQIAPDRAWTLPAFATYERSVRPAEQADVVVKLERRSPAVRGL